MKQLATNGYLRKRRKKTNEIRQNNTQQAKGEIGAGDRQVVRPREIL